MVLILVDATIFASLLFAYFHLWTVRPEQWAPAAAPLADALWPLLSAAGYAASAALILFGRRAVRMGRGAVTGVLVPALGLLLLGYGAELIGQIEARLDPAASAYGAAVYAVSADQALHAATLMIMASYVLARAWTGRLSWERRASYDNTMLLWVYGLPGPARAGGVAPLPEGFGMTASSSARGFLGEVLFAVAGLLVWAAHFLLVYGTTALLCARGAGGAFALFIIAIATGAAVAALLAVLAVARRRKPALDSSGRRLLAALAIFGSAIALVAVIWEAVAGAFLPSC